MPFTILNRPPLLQELTNTREHGAQHVLNRPLQPLDES